MEGSKTNEQMNNSKVKVQATVVDGATGEHEIALTQTFFFSFYMEAGSFLRIKFEK